HAKTQTCIRQPETRNPRPSTPLPGNSCTIMRGYTESPSSNAGSVNGTRIATPWPAMHSAGTTYTLSTDPPVVECGLGSLAASLGALRRGRRVVLTDEYEWLGGQLTGQAVPPDEHSWVEQFGVTRSYRALRDGIRQYYRDHYPLTAEARAWGDLNPGAGWVSRLCAEPRGGLAVLGSMLAPWRGG